MKQQPLLFTNDVADGLNALLRDLPCDRLFVLTDRNCERSCLPLVQACPAVREAPVIVIEPGDTHKNLEALSAVWLALSRQEATRRSLLLNVGGGMVTDLGGFAAATFKRGVRFVNISTTLLGAVDAAVGGKTGINFDGLKNEIGVFQPAEAVLISSRFFETLSTENRLSGYAEMLKHGLISGPAAYDELLAFDLSRPGSVRLLELLKTSVQVKERIVAEDPYEKGLRKALNLGHTFGHAFESLSHRREAPVPHGYAVAWGLVCELLLSHLKLRFPIERVRELAAFVQERYGAFPITCKEYEALYECMTHDKKNEAGVINFTLLQEVGAVRIDQSADRPEIETVFDLYRDLFRL